MVRDTETPRVAIQVSRGTIVASIQVDLDDPVLAQLQQDLLERIHATGARAAILDVSGLEILDASELAALRRIIATTRLLGARSLLAGLRPGVVSALIQMGADVEGLESVIDLDAAYELLEADLEPEPDGEGAALDGPPGDGPLADVEPRTPDPDAGSVRPLESDG